MTKIIKKRIKDTYFVAVMMNEMPDVSGLEQ